MTETQAKSGATGASTDTPDAPAAPTDASAEANETGAPESSQHVIRRVSTVSVGGSTSPTDAPASGPSATDEDKTARPASSPMVVPGAAKSAPPTPAAKREPPTTRLSTAEPTVRTGRASVPGSSLGTPTRLGETTRLTEPSTGAGTVGRATVAPSSTTKPGASSRTGAAAARAVTGAAAVGAARVTETFRSARATVAGAATRGPRRARLHLKRVDPWSVMKFSFAVSLVLFVVAVVATSVLYLALDAMNVFDSVNTA